MTMINLKDHYPFCREDCCMDVSEDLAELFAACDRREAAYRSRVHYHKAYYSLDRGDGVEHLALHESESPEETCVQNEAKRELYAAMRKLPGKQQRRIYAYFFMGMSMTEIAAAEGVGCATISQSIHAGIRNLEKSLKTSEKGAKTKR